MRVSLLTIKGDRLGIKLLNLLRWNDIPVEQVVASTDSWQRRVSWWRGAIRRIGPAQTVAYAALGLFSPFARQRNTWRGRLLERDYSQLARRVDYTSSTRSEDTIRVLRRDRPDLCLLGNTGIVPQAVLEIPSLGTLNAHPGILPDYRGLDTRLWAIHEGRFDKVGCTLHVVDAGIDTGPLLEARPYHWIGDESLNLVAWRLNEMRIDLLADACRETWPDYLAQAVPQAGGKLYRLMPPRLIPQVRRNLSLYLSGVREGAR